MRDRAFTQTEFELDEPLVPGGHTVFRTMHTPGYEGWTVSRFRQHTGPTPDWDPDQILTDLDRDGVDAAVLFPNFALFPMYTDDHEFSMAHARVYNDWLAETYLRYAHRLRPIAAIPTTDIPDAVKEIDRAVSLGLTGLVLPEHPQPLPYHADPSTSRCGPRRRPTGCRSSSTSHPAAWTASPTRPRPVTRSRAS